MDHDSNSEVLHYNNLSVAFYDQSGLNNHTTQKIKFHSDQKYQLQETREDSFSFSIEIGILIFLSIILKSPKVFSVIKICKRSLNGTTIYTRKYLIGNSSRCGFFSFS